MRIVAVTLLVTLGLTGCGSADRQPATETASRDSSGQYAAQTNAPSTVAMDSSVTMDTVSVATDPSNGIEQPPAAGERKIIYTATVDLVVKDLKATESRIRSLVNDSNGQIAQFHQDRRYGDQLETSWTLRIPVANFDAFVDSVCEIGIPESRRIESVEVTEQFIDLQAGLENAKRTEKEYQKFLEDRTKSVDDVTRIYEKLSNVRREIDSLEGKLRHLTNRITMTTVTITAREDKEYTPPQAPNFTTTIKDTFGTSFASLQSFGKGCVLFAVAIAPWLPPGLLVALPIWYFLLRRRKTRRAIGRS